MVDNTNGYVIGHNENSKVYRVQFEGHWGTESRYFWGSNLAEARVLANKENGILSVTPWKKGITVQRFK